MVEFSRNKLLIFIAKGLVMLDQRSDLFRLRDLDWFDRCENLKFSAVCPPKCKMKVSDFERNAANMAPIWSTARLFCLHFDLYALFLCMYFE